MPALTDLELIAIDAATLFVLDADNRILRTNDPPHSPAPRLHLAGCATGNLLRLRHDLPPATAHAIAALAADEPPLTDPATPPRHLDDYVALLSHHAPVAQHNAGLAYALPHHVTYTTPDAHLVSSGTRDGDQLLARLETHGMPEPLVTAGFTEPAHFWPPWCIVLVDGEIASVCFAARLGHRGAEAGLYTFPPYRGRGLGATATAAWSAHPALEVRALFYSTSPANLSSQRVAARLGLRLIGATYQLT